MANKKQPIKIELKKISLIINDMHKELARAISRQGIKLKWNKKK